MAGAGPSYLILNFGEVSNLAQIPSFNARTLSQRMEVAVHESQRHRCSVADCLLAARKSPEPRGIAEPIKADGIVLPFLITGRG